MKSLLTIISIWIGVLWAPGVRTLADAPASPPAEGSDRAHPIGAHDGGPDTRGWFRGALAWDKSPVDLQFLNGNDRPAGRRGFVKADGDRLVFADGTIARFWGVNLGSRALFDTPRKNIAPQARRIAQLGYNLVRLHHHDTWSNVFDPARPDTRHLGPKAMDQLDWWIKSLKDEGAYLWIDLRVGRALAAGDGVTMGIDEIMRAADKFKGFHYYNSQLHQLMVEFQHQYLGHVNRYTGLAYKDDPAVVCLLITNEDDLTHHYGNMMLPNKNNPVHNAVFTRNYQAFARAHGLPADRVYQTWLPGPSKIYLNDVEHQFNEAMIADLRALGARSPIVTTNFWFPGAAYTLPALTDGDVIDVHSYGTGGALSDDPRHVANYVSFIAAAQVHDKPLSVSEWNVLYDTPQSPREALQADRFTGPLYMASIAGLQGWDMASLYIYSQSALAPPRRQEVWSTFFDPALTGTMPAAALAFRQGHISAARKTYCLALSPDQLFNRALSAKTSATIRTLVEQSRLSIGLPAVKELPWLKPSRPSRDVTVLSDPDRDFLPPGQQFAQSDTGEIKRDWGAGTQTIDAPRTQAVSGGIGGKSLETRDATFRFQTKQAVVALTSVDGQPLAASKFVLITAMARVVAGPEDSLPLLSEPVIGTISFRSATAGLQLLALGADGHTVSRSTPPRTEAGLTISLPSGRGTHWYLLKADKPSKGTGPAKSKAGG